MKLIFAIMFIFSFEVLSTPMIIHLIREEPNLRRAESPGGGVSASFLRTASVTVLLNVLSNAGWEGIKKAAGLGNQKAKDMLEKYKDKVNANIREIQERDRLRDIARGNFDAPRVRIVHGNGRAVPVGNKNPEL